MHQLMATDKNATMTSLEISELVESRHDSVKRTIERLSASNVITQPPTVDESYVDGSGRTVTTKVYCFSGEQGKRNSIIVVAQLSPEFTARLVDRWHELETKAQNPTLQLAHAVLLANQVIADQKLLIADMQPKADFFDAVTDSKDAVDIGTVAKVLNMGIGRTRLFQFLRDEKILMENNQPYQQYIDEGYFRIVESHYSKPDGSSHVSFKTIVYQKGVVFIRKRLMKKMSSYSIIQEEAA